MNESTPKKRSGNATIEAVFVVLFIVAIICAVAMPSFVRPRSHSCQNACINNLRQIDWAKKQASSAENWKSGDVPDVNIVNQFIKGNTTPVCPGSSCRYCNRWRAMAKDAKYSYGLIGSNPTCNCRSSTTTHRMPVEM